MRLTPVLEFFTFTLLILTFGFVLGLIFNSYIHNTKEDYYVKQCLINNSSSELNVVQIIHCKHSFETFKVKR